MCFVQHQSFTEYKCLSALIEGFGIELAEFLEAQSISLGLRAPPAAPHQPRIDANFGFEGEYSTVAMDFDTVRRKDEIGRTVMQLKQSFEKLEGLRFR